MYKINHIFSVALLALVLFSCKKNTPIDAENALTYYPLTVGKQITYKLDSTNYVGYTTVPILTSYFAKDEVTEKIKDNIGRDSYRVVRYIKKNINDGWSPSSSYMVTPLDKSIEAVENNLRYIKLMNPVTPSFSWKGNSYIETQGAYSNLTYLFDWEFQYDSIRLEKKYNQFTFPETITVRQADATDGAPSNPNGYSERNFGIEVYAKNVGLVYKDFLHWSYQPPNGGNPGYRTGYGIRLTIIDKN